MSDRVIRLGGSHIGNRDSIHNLTSYLAASQGRSFVVVSALPVLLQKVEEAIDHIFTVSVDVETFQQEIIAIARERVGEDLSEDLYHLVEQLTNLSKGIALIGDYSPSLRDQFITFAEKISVEMLKIQWKRINPAVGILWPEEIGLRVNEDFGNSSFISLDKDKMKNKGGEVYIIPGSYGLTQKGKIARSGKTAADYTAAFLVSELDIPKLQLWDLDKDFQRAKPEIVPDTPVIQRLTYEEASELAYFEHYSFHPRTVEPLEGKHIPIEVIRSDSDKGKVKTVINTETYVEEQIVKSVACTDDISLLKLVGPGVGLKPGILAKTTGTLNRAGINIKSVITSQTSINIVLGKDTVREAWELIQNLGFTSVKNISLEDEVSLIGVVGHGMQNNYGVSARIFSAVAKSRINVLLSGSGASDLVSYLVVSASDKEKSVREIYGAFFDIK